MPTKRFCQVFGIPERTYRRWQARARAGRSVKGPWPRPARSSHRDVVTALAVEHLAWVTARSGRWPATRASPHDAIAAVELALAEAQRLAGAVPLVEQRTDPDTGQVVPITLVTDNGARFARSGSAR